jgi:hypothetical protein
MSIIRGDKPFGGLTHTYLELPQGYFYIAAFISNKEKCHVFLFIFSLLQNQRMGGKIDPSQGGGLATVGGGEVEGKRVGG